MLLRCDVILWLCVPLLIYSLFGCALKPTEKVGAVKTITTATNLQRTIDLEAEISNANYLLCNNNFPQSEAHLLVALRACETDSQLLRVNSLLATVYELENKLPESEARWRECVRLTEIDGAITERCLDYMRSQARILKKMGQNEQSSLLEDEITGFNFDRDNPAENSPHAAAVSQTSSLACPKCRASDSAIPIKYAVPSDELLRQETLGRVRLGGVVPMPEKFYCSSCRNSW